MRAVDIVAMLRLARNNRKESVEEMAPRMGYSRSAVSRWENNFASPSLTSLVDWAESLDLEVTLRPKVANGKK